MASNELQTVFVRVEGLKKTIFDGEVKSQGHEVTTESGGKHMCDGTKCEQQRTPGNTPTASLDTASNHGKNFKFDGKWFESMGDFLIDKIGDDKGWWHIFVNGQYLQVGGCQYQTQPYSYILWAYDGSRPSPLKLEVLSATRVNQETIFSVKSWETGGPVGSATVHGVQSDENGIAIVIFKERGKIPVRAEKDKWIRSNTLTVNVT
ncbi:hypothetical protein J3459_017152 [Metarhizium acridum]|nr:hypothetical protein J3459_017152 [Metarhizium acridum]